MIRVNLLPHHLRPVKSSPVPHLISLVVLVGCIVFAFIGFFRNQSQIYSLRETKEQLDSEFVALRNVVEEYNRLSQQKKDLQNRIETIQEILKDRIIWSQYLHRLAALTPDNIWYKRIRVTWQTFRETVQKRDPKTGQPVINPNTKQPETEVKSDRKQVLEVSGYIVNDEQGQARLTPLLERTTQDPEFSALFQLNRPTLDTAEFQGFQVRSFTVEYLVQKGGGKA